MNDQNKQKQRPEETPKNSLGGASAANSSSGLKKLFAKRWVSPAIFMAAAAIIVTLMWIYQGSDPAKPTTATEESTEVSQGGEQVEGGNKEETSEEVTAIAEDMKWPVASAKELQIETNFYDSKASATEREAALVQVGNTFTPHTGIDFADPNNEAFDVLAALDGKITLIETHPTNGNIVEISHGNGLVTVYQSLTNVQVGEGDEVKQGTIIAQAGRSDTERDLGVHLHFETRLNGQSINPGTYIAE
ncbi:peptidoglycan DD-metalloendopeptidase family protein [Paenibacillus sp. GCM10027627]|uniref:peptidoglycan DD-metalloendopeptidase family protein n=1 Tax=unclassified Paenibacillus TaxID=185978 RepID=UPI003630DCE9